MTLRTRITIGLVWFFTMGGLGSFFPFFSMYLLENGQLSGSQIGMVLALLPTVGLASQPFWGQIADRSGARTRVLAILGVGASLGYLGLGQAETFADFLLGVGFLAFFAPAILPTCVAVTLAVVRDAGPHGFGLSRVWGTVGFFVLVVSFPYALDAWQALQGLVAAPGGPSEPGLELLFPITATSTAIGAALALALPSGGAVALRAERGAWRLLLHNTAFLRVVLFAFVGFLFLQGPMAMFSVFVRAEGGSLDSVSQMWILMLVLEVPLVAGLGVGLERIGPRGLLATGVFAGGIRWVVSGFSADLDLITGISILHGVMVAGLVMGGPMYVERVVPERLRNTAQGVFAMIGFSLGGILSNLCAGWLLEHYGAEMPYRVGGIGALVLCSLVLVILPRAIRREPSD